MLKGRQAITQMVSRNQLTVSISNLYIIYTSRLRALTTVADVLQNLRLNLLFNHEAHQSLSDS